MISSPPSTQSTPQFPAASSLGDTIQLTGLKAYGYVGALPEEKVLGQWFGVDLTLWVDLSPAADSDHLADTCDYRQIIAATEHLVQTAKFDLIERLAGAIADIALNDDARVQQVRVKVTKLAVPIPNFSGQIAVEITRRRP